MSYFNAPRPAYANPPIEPQYFLPNAFVIGDITMGATTTVNTLETFYGVSNTYVVGQLIRFVIPRFYGARQLNNQLAYVISILGANEFIVDINSTNYDAFIPHPSYGPTLPQILAVGDVNTGFINTGRSANGTFIPGSFINISPQ